MNVHLVTVIGADIKLLPRMLEHYRNLGVRSFIVNLNIQSHDDPILSEAYQYTNDFGCGISCITTGKWSEALNLRLYNQSRAGRPNDWFLLADLDEFQVYPESLLGVLERCEADGYDHIEGCLIDRVAADGKFPALSGDRSLDEQFPLGCMFTYAFLGGNPLKIVAAKGKVRVSAGNHQAINGLGCPPDKYFIQVYHYKWMSGLIERMKCRANNIDAGVEYSAECQKFVEYYDLNHGRIDISDPRLWVSECKAGYGYWGQVRESVSALRRLHP